MVSLAAKGSLLEVERYPAPSTAARVPAETDAEDAVVAALLCGGDSRIRVDPASGWNKYLCPARPAPHLTCFASCTASPIVRRSFVRAAAAYHDIAGGATARLRAERLTRYHAQVAARLLRYFEATGRAEAILCPSGTDALLTAALLLAAERPGRTLTAILPGAAETGTGVKLAATCRQFDGPAAGRPLCDNAVTTVEIPLRRNDGTRRPDDELNAAYAAAATTAPGRPVVYLTHGSKTGLIAPVEPPPNCDVVVDACQARIAPARVVAYLRRGWPLAVTGSKFFGGPAFSGALLVPRTRPGAQHHRRPESELGSVLRWTAAVAVLDGFAHRADEMTGLLQERAAAVAAGLAACPAVVPVAGLTPGGTHWSDHPSIFSFAVRDRSDPARLLTLAELRPLYEALAARGVLLGQPVGLGAHGGLRIAFGARDLLDDTPGSGALHRAFDALAELTG